MFYFDPWYLLFIAPGLLLAMWAQARISWAYSAAQQVPTHQSGASAARYILDSAGLQHIPIEQTPGQLSDHYDPSEKVVRLSPEVYHGRDMASVGIAAHEVGHAMQDAEQYSPLVIRNAAVPIASLGSILAFILAIIGMAAHISILTWAGIALFGGVVFFQLVNLPVEYDASNRAKEQLVASGMVKEHELHHVSGVLDAAALTYVAATLQAVMIFAYLIMRARGSERSYS